MPRKDPKNDGGDIDPKEAREKADKFLKSGRHANPHEHGQGHDLVTDDVIDDDKPPKWWKKAGDLPRGWEKKGDTFKGGDE